MTDDKFIEMAKQHRKDYIARLLSLGFVAELAIQGPPLEHDEGRPAWGGTLWLRNDGTMWGDANDGNIPGLDGTGLVRDDGVEDSLLKQGGLITRVSSILPDLVQMEEIQDIMYKDLKNEHPWARQAIFMRRGIELARNPRFNPELVSEVIVFGVQACDFEHPDWDVDSNPLTTRK